jgi:hypothetical protein
VSIAEFNPEDFQQTNQQKMDEQLLVKFYVKACPDQAESVKQGRPIFRDKEYIDIRIPGDRTAGAARPARAQDIARFPRHYKAFKERTSQELNEGTPLTEWPVMTKSQAEELAFFHVKTVEQLATMSDAHTSKFMGLSKLKRKAQEWLISAKDQRAATEMAQELEQRDLVIATQQKQLDDLAATVEKLAANQKKKPGRKKPTAKVAPDDSTDNGDSERDT